MNRSRFAPSVVLSLVLVFFASTAPAATFVVNSTEDAPDAVPGNGVCASESGACTLRAATMEANAVPGHDTIEIPAGTYLLTRVFDGTARHGDDSRGDLVLTDHTSMVGAGAETTIIDASAITHRVLAVLGERSRPDPLQVEIAGVTLTGGFDRFSVGGGILHEGNGTLTIREAAITDCTALSASGGALYHQGTGFVGHILVVDSLISGNSASTAGGIYNGNGTLEIIRSTVTGNTAFVENDPYRGQCGGGVYTIAGRLTAVDSTISDNLAARSGGGICSVVSPVLLERTTVSGNTALDVVGAYNYRDGNGGGIWAIQSQLHLFNSTISGNTAASQGGGVFMVDSDWSSRREGHSYYFVFSTIADNRNESGLPGAGVMTLRPYDISSPNYETLKGSIVSNNTSDGVASDCSLALEPKSQGFNIDGDGSCGFSHPMDRPAVDPDLEALSDNGGPTATHALPPWSVAVDLAPTSQCFVIFDEIWDFQGHSLWVDQRGEPRRMDAGCDAGSFEFGEEPTVEETIEEFIVDLRELIDDGEISYSRGRSLIAELQVALWFLGYNGGEAIAAIRIELFIIKVEGMLDRGEVEPELGEELLTRARAILEMLRG